MRIIINKPHIKVWLNFLVWWAVYVLIAIVVGWRLSPRVDEIVFAVCIPLIVVIPYAIFCLLIAAVRAWWPRRNDGLPHRVMLVRIRLIAQRSIQHWSGR